VKRALLSPAAKQDRRDEVRYYRDEAGNPVAKRLVEALTKALQALEQQPAMGSPAIGLELGIEGLRAWRLDGFPLSVWYFERADHVQVVRLVGQRQEAEFIDVPPRLNRRAPFTTRRQRAGRLPRRRQSDIAGDTIAVDACGHW